MKSQLPHLRLARYRFKFHERPRDDGAALDGADYLGSAWRGAFGRALRKAVCATRLPACDPCMLLESCVYPWLFESRTPPGASKMTRYPRTPGPFVLEPHDRRFDSRGGSVTLGVVLIGQANEQLPLVAHALERAGHGGLTARRIQLDLAGVQVEALDTPAGNRVATGDSKRERAWVTVYEPGGRLSSPGARCPRLPACPDAVLVRLLTPFRAKRDNRLVNNERFDFRVFASTLVRRISMLTTFFGEAPLEMDFAELLRRAETVRTGRAELRWQAWTRYSSRQKARLRMDGLVGCFEVEGRQIKPFWPFLWLGQWTHVGKGTSMGLGRYALEPVDRSGWVDPDPSGRAGHAGVAWAGPARL